MKCFVGIDVVSISTKRVVIDKDCQVLADCYLRTLANPIAATKEVLSKLRKNLPSAFSIGGSATTGSALRLAGIMVNADIVKNAIIAHAVAGAICTQESAAGISGKIII